MPEITPAEWEAVKRLPGAQDREQWRTELRAVLQAARERGDTRPGGEIITAWLKFRVAYEDGPR